MTTHPSPRVIARYAYPGADLDEVTVWSVEVHLEACADCRALLAGGTADDTRALLDRVAAQVDLGIAAGPAPVARRRRLAVPNRWIVWHLVPWLTMTVAILACAVLLDALATDLPSAVSLLAPVAPLPGVAIAWSRWHDPAWEVIAATPSSGLALLLRRTAGVLAVVVPALALASTRTGVSLAVTLLPCLAFTAGTIALGALVGVRRAAIGLGAAWTVAVIAPAVATAEPPAVLQPGSAGVWALLTVVLTVLAARRTTDFRRLTSHH